LLLYREVQKVPIASWSAYHTAVHHRFSGEDARAYRVNLIGFNVGCTGFALLDVFPH
jgi:hypothetical protein